jgi:PAS domain S-box-containing protein
MSMRNTGVVRARPEGLKILLMPRRESSLIGALLLSIGVQTTFCHSIQELCGSVESGAAIVILAEDVLDANALNDINAALRTQPVWSDVPFIVLVDRDRARSEDDFPQTLLMSLGFVIFVEKPIQPVHLVVAVETALKAREMQYAFRDLLSARNTQDAMHAPRSVNGFAIVNLDSGGIITHWGVGAASLFGYSEAEALGRSYSLLFTDEDRALGVPSREIEIARTVGRAEDERWQLRKGGSVFWCSGVLVTTPPVNGDPPGYVRISREVVSRLSEEAMVRQTEALQASNEELKQFAYATSHDLQEPLRMIIAYSDYLQRELQGSLTPRSEQLLSYILQGGQRMQRLIEGLLAYSRALHNIDGPFVLTDPSPVLERALENLQRVIIDKSATVTSSSLPMVMAHEVHLLQLFQNLVGNALKYSRENVNPVVAVSGTIQDRFAVFSVADNGIGIPAEYRADVFGIFKRLHGKEYSGAGIGLAICQTIVSRYGGRIWVESEESGGSTFHFTLPAGDSPATA